MVSYLPRFSEIRIFMVSSAFSLLQITSNVGGTVHGSMGLAKASTLVSVTVAWSAPFDSGGLPVLGYKMGRPGAAGGGRGRN